MKFGELINAKAVLLIFSNKEEEDYRYITKEIQEETTIIHINIRKNINLVDSLRIKAPTMILYSFGEMLYRSIDLKFPNKITDIINNVFTK